MIRLGALCSVLALGACATPDTPCCIADGGACLLRADIPPGSVLARRFVQLGAPGCEKKVCVSDDSVAQNKVELLGYCTVQCRPGLGCPGSRLGPMECMQLVDYSDDAGLSVCVRPSDAGQL